MILSRRKTHFYTVIFLTCSLPIVFFLGLLWRPSIPKVDNRIYPLFAQANFASDRDNFKVIASENLTVDNITLTGQLIQSYKGLYYLSLQPNKSLQFADILAYWTNNLDSENVSDQAILLGQLSGNSRRYFPISKQNNKEPAYLVLYSLSQDLVIASVPIPTSLFPEGEN